MDAMKINDEALSALVRSGDRSGTISREDMESMASQLELARKSVAELKDGSVEKNLIKNVSDPDVMKEYLFQTIKGCAAFTQVLAAHADGNCSEVELITALACLDAMARGTEIAVESQIKPLSGGCDPMVPSGSPLDGKSFEEIPGDPVLYGMKRMAMLQQVLIDCLTLKTNMSCMNAVMTLRTVKAMIRIWLEHLNAVDDKLQDVIDKLRSGSGAETREDPLENAGPFDDMPIQARKVHIALHGPGDGCTMSCGHERFSEYQRSSWRDLIKKTVSNAVFLAIEALDYNIACEGIPIARVSIIVSRLADSGKISYEREKEIRVDIPVNPDIIEQKLTDALYAELDDIKGGENDAEPDQV